MGATTFTTTFTIPGLAKAGGTFSIWPHFHRTSVFPAGGYDWSISYYPDSLYDSDSIDLCLQLETRGSKVTISSSVSLLGPTATLPPMHLVKPSPPMNFDDSEDDDRIRMVMVTHWVPKRTLRVALRHGYLQAQGGLLFEWTIAVIPDTATPMALPVPVPVPQAQPKLICISEPRLKLPATDVAPVPMPEPEPMAIPEPKLPATDVAPMPMPTPKLPAMTEVAPAAKVPATDVTYSVGGELFHAHKIILATQSPVFKAELSKAMTAASELAPAIVEVDGMRPDVFEALLGYIYTDALPATEEGQSDEDATSQMMRDLLVAADRYDLERLKLLCEGKLSEIVDVDNVAEMLAFADDHYCCALEDACIKFMATSGRMKKVVQSPGYQRLRTKHPLILVDVLEKFLIFHNV